MISATPVREVVGSLAEEAAAGDLTIHMAAVFPLEQVLDGLGHRRRMSLLSTRRGAFQHGDPIRGCPESVRAAPAAERTRINVEFGSGGVDEVMAPLVHLLQECVYSVGRSGAVADGVAEFHDHVSTPVSGIDGLLAADEADHG